MREELKPKPFDSHSNKKIKILKNERKYTTMTNREFNTAVINANINDELTEYATAEIEKLDATNAKRREKAAEKAAEKAVEKAPIREALFNVISAADEPQTATALIEAAGLDIKPQSIPSLLKPFVEDGSVLKVDVKVKGKGTQRGYVLA